MNTDDMNEEKEIEETLRKKDELITEADEAANAAEGFDTMETHIFEDVPEDREAVEANIPEELENAPDGTIVQ